MPVDPTSVPSPLQPSAPIPPDSPPSVPVRPIPSPLHEAARIGDHDAIRTLVAGGADLNATFNNIRDPSYPPQYLTPLMVAAGSADGASVTTVQLLLDLGADPTITFAGLSAATYACSGISERHAAMCDAARLRAVLLAGSPVPSDPDIANRILCKVAELGDADRLQLLLSRGCGSVNGYFDPVTARVRAMWHNKEFAKYLAREHPESLRFGAYELSAEAKQHIDSYSAGPSDAELPLFCAAKSNNPKSVRLLLQANADARKRDSSEQTAMHFARTAETIELLHTAGGDVDAVDSLSMTPLMYAAGSGNLEATKALLRAGANPNAACNEFRTVLMVAVQALANNDLIDELLAAGADPHQVTSRGDHIFYSLNDRRLSSVEETRATDLLRRFVNLGVDINRPNNIGFSPLATAIGDGHAVEVRILCSLGADPNSTRPAAIRPGDETEVVQWPMLIDACHCLPENEKLLALLSAGADPLITDHEGRTGLEHLLRSLCREFKADDWLYAQFLAALAAVRPIQSPLPSNRDDFLAAVSVPIRRIVDSFDTIIPRKEPDYGSGYRAGVLNCIVTITAHQWWARHTAEARSGTPPTNPDARQNR